VGGARAFRALDPRSAVGRVTLALIAGALVTTVMWTRFGWAMCAVAGWDAGALTLLGLAWWIIGRASADETRRRAASEDPGRSVAWGFVLFCSAFSLFTATVVLRQAKHLAPENSAVLVVLCLIAVAAAWALTHTSYTLRYAHLYYRDTGEGEGGLGFPGDEPPSDFDFAYFAFTVGMCFQVSDVTVVTRALRRAVLGHSVLSFAFNTAILAVALNLVFGLLG
jgi:uncharacterized membrane protein